MMIRFPSSVNIKSTRIEHETPAGAPTPSDRSIYTTFPGIPHSSSIYRSCTLKTHNLYLLKYFRTELTYIFFTEIYYRITTENHYRIVSWLFKFPDIFHDLWNSAWRSIDNDGWKRWKVQLKSNFQRRGNFGNWAVAVLPVEDICWRRWHTELCYSRWWRSVQTEGITERSGQDRGTEPDASWPKLHTPAFNTGQLLTDQMMSIEVYTH